MTLNMPEDFKFETKVPNFDPNWKPTTLEEMKKYGTVPEWMDEAGYSTLEKGYLLNGETPLDMYRRVANAAGSYYADSDYWSTKFMEAMWKNWICPASPVLSNLGTVRGLPISCNSIHVGDSVDSIFGKSRELAMLSKNGAGVGIYLGDVRGRGANISGNGKSEGIIPWAKVYDTTTVSVSQGSTRRGASAAYLPVRHLDIDE
ncbi:MAG TPA: ribonucleotide reductase N-terminal alpha domain-containing protein, partial [Rhabdochlamydiaceae bacterium]